MRTFLVMILPESNETQREFAKGTEKRQVDQNWQPPADSLTDRLSSGEN